VNPDRTADATKQLARVLGFDLVGIAPAEPTRETRFLREWARRGLGGPAGGPLDYVLRRLDEREDPRRVLAGAKSAVCVGLVYGDGARPAAGADAPLVARYACGDDYHEVLEDRLAALAAALEAWCERPLKTRAYVDTGPVQERALAARAGLGWLGKNTMLIHPALGSYLFLGVLLTDLEMTPDAPEPDHCGSCRACLDACPTDAFVSPHVLDATRCIAYTTIEDPGPIPEDLREGQGEWLFGCDVCQQVCPFNERRERRSGDPLPDPLGLRARLAARAEWSPPSLAWVLSLDESAWRDATRRSALRRAKRRGLLRNALVVAGNRREPSLRPLLEAHARGDDAELAEHARWALARLQSASD
jgi:epoxyqueuosine reductase